MQPNNPTELDHSPYLPLTSANIKFGYLDSSVVPSSDRAKANNIDGRQSGSLAWKSEYFSPTTLRKYCIDSLSSWGRLLMRASKTDSDISQASYPSPLLSHHCRQAIWQWTHPK